MDRRHFLRSSLCAAIGASATPFIFNSKQIHAQARTNNEPFDLIIRGGRIMAVEPALDAESRETLDASGKIVVPGLLDIHAHYLQDSQGAHIALEDGITGFVDAGSAGADNIDDIVAMARSAPQASPPTTGKCCAGHRKPRPTSTCR